MPLVSSPESFACCAEWLARWGAGPNRSIVGPPGAAEGVGPDSNASEEMTLGESNEVVGSNIDNTPGVDLARGDMPPADQFTEPGGGSRVQFVIVSAGHQAARFLASAARILKQVRHCLAPTFVTQRFAPERG